MRAIWARFNDRERKTMFAVAMDELWNYRFYFLVYDPITVMLAEHAVTWTENEETISWMQQIRKQYNPHQLRLSEHNDEKKPVLSLFSKALKTSQLNSFKYQLIQVEGHKIQLQFERVPYALFLNWLRQLSSANTFQIDTFEAERTDTSGIVRLNLVVSGG